MEEDLIEQVADASIPDGSLKRISSRDDVGRRDVASTRLWINHVKLIVL